MTTTLTTTDTGAAEAAPTFANGLRKGNVPRHLRHLPVLEQNRLDRTVRELRERGLSFPAIAIVLDLYEGLEVSWHHVREWCVRMDVPTPTKILGATSGRFTETATP